MFDWFKRRKRTYTQVQNNDAVGADPHALGLASHTFVDTSSSSDTTPYGSPCDAGAASTRADSMAAETVVEAVASKSRGCRGSLRRNGNLPQARRTGNLSR